MLRSVFLRNLLFCFVLAHSLFSPNHAAQADERLPALNASTENLTVSGLSSGGFMAVQMHVAHSALVRGAGILAGGPYYCAKGNFFMTVNCMDPGFWRSLPAIEQLVSYTETNAENERIDSGENLASSRVWLLSGSKDHTVKTEVVDHLYDFYNHWIHASSIFYERVPGAGHAMIGNDASTANECHLSESPYINHCDDFDAPGRLLSFLFGKLEPKAETVSENLVAFAQNEFVGGDMESAGLADTGYVYIPAACKGENCKIHVAFHGCKQQAERIGTLYARDAGYNGWAESNRFIVLYPQIRANKRNNPNGCWDWWGYTDGDYALKNGKQISAVKKMIDRLAEPAQ